MLYHGFCVQFARGGVCPQAEGGGDAGGFAGAHAGLLDAQAGLGSVFGGDAAPRHQQVVDSRRDDAAVGDVEILAGGQLLASLPGFLAAAVHGRGRVAVRRPDVDVPGTAGDAVGLLAELQGVVGRDCGQALEAAGRAQPDLGRGVEQVRVFQSRHVAADEIGGLAGLFAPLAFGAGKVEGIERIDLQHAADDGEQFPTLRRQPPVPAADVVKQPLLLGYDRRGILAALHRGGKILGNLCNALLARTLQIGGKPSDSQHLGQCHRVVVFTVALRPVDPALRRHDSVAGGVDHAVCEDRTPPGARLGKDALCNAILDDAAASGDVVQNRHARFGQQLVPDELYLLRIDATADRPRAVEGQRAQSLAITQPPRVLVPDALEIDAVGAQHHTDQLRDRRAAQVAVFLDQKRVRAVARRRNGRGTARRPAAANNRVVVAAQDRNFSGGFSVDLHNVVLFWFITGRSGETGWVRLNSLGRNEVICEAHFGDMYGQISLLHQ